ncbi:MAG: AAA family ATPase [Eubacterium sp.]|nr:AAA family ATPase [Eubacterium sp.]
MAEIQSRGSQVFDLNSLRKEKQKKQPEEPVCTYLITDEDTDLADADHPFMVLNQPKGRQFVHHVNGSFMNPSRRTSFEYKTDSGREYTDVLRIDRRFIQLLKWLGENQVPVRLSGSPSKEGFGIYKMHAVNYSGKISESTDAFLQLTISRILNGRLQEDPDSEEEAEEKEEVRLTDISSMTDFLACAGGILPVNIRKWAQRNLMLIRTNTISQDERRHAQRALSMMLNIQWKGSYFASIDPVRARQILDEELYGLEGVKQRIIETIIQINRTHTLPAYGLLLAGPAGVGKSQLAYAVARILKLPWAALDMSAITDPEALTGSPRVYANAKPGLIMEAFSRAGSDNLVFIINELDKADQGDNSANPADALLTLLDNLGYTDNYIECMIPTGGVYPIATANDKSRISAPLMSRFAVIDIPDYTPEEKKYIFSKFSLPKIIKRMGMRPEECVIPDEAVDVIVQKYAALPGCRDLEQAAEHLAANALYRIETEHLDGVTFTPEMIRQILG